MTSEYLVYSGEQPQYTAKRLSGVLFAFQMSRSSGSLDPSTPGKVISVVSECADAVRLGGKAKADCQRIQLPFCEVDPHYPCRFGCLCSRLDHSLQPGPTRQYGNLPPTRMRSPQRAKRYVDLQHSGWKVSRAAMAIVGPPRRLTHD